MSNLLEKASIVTTPTAYDNGKILSVKPNTSVGDFDFTRNSSATRVNSQGLIEDVQILSSNLVSNGDFSQEGSELVTNGGFDSDTDWTKLNATISDGKGNLNGDGQTSLLYQNILTQNKFYKVTFTVSDYNEIGTALIINNNGTSYYAITTNGTFTIYFKQTISNGNFLFRATNGAIFSIDNVSVKEVGQDWTVANEDANNYVEFNQDEGTVRLKFLNTSPLTTLTSDTQYSGGKKYKLTVDVKEAVSGGIKIDAAGVSQTYNSAGIQEAIIEPTGGANISFYRATADVDITLNSVSLIEITEDTNLPRIDYTGGVGSWLFEPQSTNLFTQSELFSDSSWDKHQTIIEAASIILPNGLTNGYKLFANTTGGTDHRLEKTPFPTATTGQDYTLSLFVKSAGSDFIQIASSTGLPSRYQNFNISTGTKASGDISDSSITDFGNGWYRISVTETTTGTNARYLIVPILSDGGRNPIFAGNADEDGVYIWGAMLEQNSFSTSYIPTNGSTVTRLADAAFGSGSSDLINSTEGVLYGEIAALANDLTNKQISLNNGTTDDRIQLYYSASSNQISVFYKSQSGATSFIINHTLSDITQFNKVAFKWKQNDFALWSNGVEVATQTSGVTSSADTLTKLDFLQFNGSADFFGKTKCVAVFKEALTDEELTCLTTI